MTQLKRDDWLQTGLEALGEHGVDALTIDFLCKQFGVTKGSFYHHFKNRKAFLTALLSYWEEKYTAYFIEYSQNADTAEEQIQRLNTLVLDSFGTYEVSIRVWAQSDAIAREYQMRVDQRRLDYLIQLYQELLANPDQAQAMAHLMYSALVGSTTIIPALKSDDYDNMMHLVEHLVNSLNTKGKNNE